MHGGITIIIMHRFFSSIHFTNKIHLALITIFSFFLRDFFYHAHYDKKSCGEEKSEYIKVERIVHSGRRERSASFSAISPNLTAEIGKRFLARRSFMLHFEPAQNYDLESLKCDLLVEEWVLSSTQSNLHYLTLVIGVSDTWATWWRSKEIWSTHVESAVARTKLDSLVSMKCDDHGRPADLVCHSPSLWKCAGVSAPAAGS